jgi:hypothetical protein
LLPHRQTEEAAAETAETNWIELASQSYIYSTEQPAWPKGTADTPWTWRRSSRISFVPLRIAFLRGSLHSSLWHTLPHLSALSGASKVADKVTVAMEADTMTFGEHGSSAEAKRAVSTTRVREFRKRQKLGLLVRTIRINPKHVTKLIQLGVSAFRQSWR